MKNRAILDWENDSREVFKDNSELSVQIAYLIQDKQIQTALPNKTAPYLIVLSPHIPENHLILTIFGQNFINIPSRRYMSHRAFSYSLNSESPIDLHCLLIAQIFVLLSCLLIVFSLFCVFFFLLCGDCVLSI